MCEELAELTPGDHEKRSALFNSGAEAVENAVKVARTFTGRDGGRRLRARLPRPHQPHDGADRQDRCPTSTASGRSRRRSTGRRWPTRCAGPAAPERCAERGVRRLRRHGAHPGRRDQHRRGRHRADPGRGRLHRPAAGLAARRSRTSAPSTASCSIADEIQTGFCRTGDWFACDHEGVVPDLITTAKGIAGGLPLAGGHRPRRDHGLGALRRARRHLRRQPGRLRRRARRDPRRCASEDLCRAGQGDRGALPRTGSSSCARSTTSSPTSGAAAPCSPSS